MTAMHERTDIYRRVTDAIVAAIEAGAKGGKLPWHSGGADVGCPRNARSGARYRGVNVVALWASADAGGHPSGLWATYRQWQELGAQVRKGEKATDVVFWKALDGKARDDGAEADEADGDERGRRFVARGYGVFNAAQVDGWTPPVVPELPDAERVGRAERFFAGLGADIRHGGDRACYRPQADVIDMPPFRAFRDAVAYYGVLGHEATHWTGREGRCGRDLAGRFGSEAYAMEELVAELGAAFLCGALGLAAEPRPDHAGYVASWLRVLRGDPRAVFAAAGKAQQAVDWMDARQPPDEVRAAQSRRS